MIFNTSNHTEIQWKSLNLISLHSGLVLHVETNQYTEIFDNTSVAL